jgi:hypothetical protein
MLPVALKTFQGNSPRLREVFQHEVSSWVAWRNTPTLCNASGCDYWITSSSWPWNGSLATRPGAPTCEAGCGTGRRGRGGR